MAWHAVRAFDAAGPLISRFLHPYGFLRAAVTDPRLSGAETPLCFAIASDAIEVCSTQFVIIAQLCGALADVGITMVVALSPLRTRKRSSHRRAKPRSGEEWCPGAESNPSLSN